MYLILFVFIIKIYIIYVRTTNIRIYIYIYTIFKIGQVDQVACILPFLQLNPYIPYILHLPLRSPKRSALSDWNELSKDDVFRNGAHLIRLGREDMKFSTARYWPKIGKPRIELTTGSGSSSNNQFSNFEALSFMEDFGWDVAPPETLTTAKPEAIG